MGNIDTNRIKRRERRQPWSGWEERHETDGREEREREREREREKEEEEDICSRFLGGKTKVANTQP